MARISTRNLLDGGQRVTPPTATTSAVSPQDVRDPVTGLTPAQVAAQQALSQAVATGAAVGIQTKPNVATGGNVPTVTVTKTPARTTATTPVVTTPVTTTSTTPSTTGPTTTYTAPDGRIFTDLNAYNAYLGQLKTEEKRRTGQSAFDLLKSQFAQYGLEGLVAPLQGFIIEGLSPAEFTLKLRETDAYRQRFAANQSRIARGLRSLSEAEYIALEDQYQNVMRRYGLPQNYYTRGDMGRQEGFEKFIAGDVSAAELEDRISNAQERVLQSTPEVGRMLRQFYPDITNGDILAYALDPQNALNVIKRKITAAEIGAGAAQAGFATAASRAEELAQYGVSKETARQGFQAIADILPRGSQLAEFYGKQGVSPYTQTTAEQEVFGLAGAAEAGRQRRKLTELEQATFSGRAGAAGGALARDRAGQY